MERRAYNLLAAAGLKSAITPVRESGVGPGAGLFLWLPQAGFSSLGRPGLPAENVAEAAVGELLAFAKSGAMVDRHLADQLLLPLALAKGESSYTTDVLTLHTTTAAQLLGQWLDDISITISGELGRPATVRVEGCGLTAN
jgi:RNA 3'-terminal phosphate cyclase (ATP)